jgi:hypothetical protein
VTPKAESCADPADENCDGYDCVQWAQLFGGAADQYTTDVAVDAMGNSYVVGYFEGTIPFNGKTLIDVGSGDGFILKFDPAGKPIWGQQFGDGDFQLINTLAIDSAGNVLFGGRSVSPISLGGLVLPAGLFVAKFDGDGHHIWSKGLTDATMGCSAYQSDINSIAVTPQDDIVIAGDYCGTIDFGDGAIPSQGPVPPQGVQQDGFVAKLRGMDGSGKASDGAWAKTFGDAKFQRATRIAVDTPGNIIVAGDFQGAMSLGPGATMNSAGDKDIFIAKLSASGSPIWNRRIGDVAEQAVIDLAIDPTGGPIVLGSFHGDVNFGDGSVVATGSDGNAFVAKYAADNAYEWSKIFPDGANAAVSAAIGKDGNVLLAGVFQGSLDLGAGPLDAIGSGYAFFLAKLTPGGVVWNKRYGDTMDIFAVIGCRAALTPSGEPTFVGGVADPIDFGTGKLTSSGNIDGVIAKFSP